MFIFFYLRLLSRKAYINALAQGSIILTRVLMLSWEKV